MKLQKNQFSFTPASSGSYMVTYTSPSRKRKYTQLIQEMPLVDAVKFKEFPTQKAMRHLRHRIILKIS